MKIVIVDGCNSCVYSISSEIITRYFELSSMSKPFFYIRELGYYSISDENVKFERVDSSDNYFHVSLNDLGKTIISDKMLFDDDNYFDIEKILRNDINLVAAVEELKPKNLKIVEIPDDVDWYIHESDSGFESIHESHRSWF